SLLFRKRHVLTLAATNRLRLERLDPAAVISHVGAVHGAQRNAHRFGYRGLRRSAFAQQHHLDALALRRRDFPPQGCLQLPDLLLGTLDHPSPPNQMVKANHITSLSASQKIPQTRDSNSYGSGMTILRRWSLRKRPNTALLSDER